MNSEEGFGPRLELTNREKRLVARLVLGMLLNDQQMYDAAIDEVEADVQRVGSTAPFLKLLGAMSNDLANATSHRDKDRAIAVWRETLAEFALESENDD